MFRSGMALALLWPVVAPVLAGETTGGGPVKSGGVTVYPAPEGAPPSGQWAVTVDGQKLDVYGHKGHAVSFATCDIDGRVAVTVTPKFTAARVTVHPLSRGRQAGKAEAGWTFEVDKPCSLTLVADGDCLKAPLHLFLNPPAEKPPEGAIVFGPGRHVLEKPIILKSGQTLHLAGGAWVEGVVRAGKAEDIAIQGRGVLCQGDKEATGIALDRCRNVRLNGIVETKTGRGWCTVLSQCSDVQIRNYHVIGVGQPTTDGLNPCNSQDVTIEDSFFRSHDDCIAIKGNSGGDITKKTPVVPPATQPPVENILIRRCTFWSSYNNVICIGAETRAKHFKNIRVEDCDVLYHRKYWRDFGTFSILPLHGTSIEDIVFDIDFCQSKGRGAPIDEV